LENSESDAGVNGFRGCVPINTHIAGKRAVCVNFLYPTHRLTNINVTAVKMHKVFHNGHR
jgi:hypothetical protein